MSALSATVRTHRIIGGLAVVHALIIAGVVIGMGLYGLFPAGWLWIAFVTLWLAWPVALLVHRGRSLRRVLIPLSVSVLLIWWFAWSDYTISAPAAAGLPLGVSIYPRDLHAYFTARQQGRTAAERDISNGVLAVEEYGMPKPQQFREMLQQRYHIDLRQIAGDTDVTAKVMGHAKGYNEIAAAEIARRFGAQTLQQTEDEAWKEYWHGNVPK